jgi:hypothetical protein
MYKHVIYETWLDWVPYVAFGVTALVFLTFAIRAVALKKERCDQLSNLPLE